MMVSPPEALFGSFQLLEMEAALWGARGLSWGWGWLIVRLHKSQGWDPLTWHDTSQKDVQVLRAQTLTAADVSHGRPGCRLWSPDCGDHQRCCTNPSCLTMALHALPLLSVSSGFLPAGSPCPHLGPLILCALTLFTQLHLGPLHFLRALRPSLYLGLLTPFFCSF